MAGAFQQWLTWSFSPSVSAIFVTLFISLIIPILIHTYLYRKAVAQELPTVLLVGPSGAGKTSLLTLFANGAPSATHTSQEPQTAVCQLPASTKAREDRYRCENDTTSRARPKFLLLDTPGHGKLRDHGFLPLRGERALKGLVFMVDSAAVSSVTGLIEAAEYLHDVLLLLQKRHTQGKTSKTTSVPVLVAANKQDVFTSLPANLVQSKLEQEIAKVRQTRSKGLLDSGIGMDDGAGGDEEASWLGEYGAKDFKFAQMEEHGVDIKVLGGNVKDGEQAGKVDEWWDWIGDNL
ncbi:P-loop containing nucleoside triphosphate hydrolase protein [Teratosphaeria nubilosa]|uniref:Signal recognition particle receptor subunit beta n=1 Tax=Teratosphaeria nubilosa TaxID=161662 RepID=A0A6G1LP20_9PEZI|nr:P-loop containing nucleoside triphosphate hydrolase protein [Teratosphaeria nubilosa]